jgi:ATP-dependent RNA helicase DDX23/PRP28
MPVPQNSADSIPSPAAYIPPMTDTDLSAIRSRYLGVDKKKRKIRKMNDRKFVFDWDAQDDTAADLPAPPVAQGQGVAQVMFGRGHIAGMDDYQSAAGTRRSTADANLADPIERRKALKSGTDERHWSDKPLSEMKERDWRIFREDFSIAARGTIMFNSFSVSLIDTCRRINTASFAILDRVGHPTSNPRDYRNYWVQGTFTYSEASHSNWFTKSRYHWHC